MTGDTRRINRGSGHSYLLDGTPVLGVTSILAEGYPKPALVDWAGRETAGYAVNHWAELGELDVAQRLRKLEKGRFEHSRGAAARGTAVHKYAELLLAGAEVSVPDELVDIVDSCLAFLRDWGVDELVVEPTIINREWRYMGAADLVARLAGGPDVWLLDWKTGASGVWPEVALQLSAYAHAESMLAGDDFERPFPNIERAAAVHLRSDGYDLIPVDISPATFATFLYVKEVAEFRARPKADFVGPPLAPPTFEATS